MNVLAARMLPFRRYLRQIYQSPKSVRVKRRIGAYGIIPRRAKAPNEEPFDEDH